jgi:Rieske Fe-S protein
MQRDDDADRRPSRVAGRGFLQRRAGRRDLVAAAIGAGIAGVLARAGAAAPVRPQAGDRFVYAQGEKEGEEVRPLDLAVGGPQIVAWPVDPATGKKRDESLLNQVIIIRLDPAELDEPTRGRAAEGILAYSAICTHAQCPVAGWKEDKRVLHCPCHDSEYDPRIAGKVVFGPAPRPLPGLPLRLEGGVLVAAGPFTGRVGLRPA